MEIRDTDPFINIVQEDRIVDPEDIEASEPMPEERRRMEFRQAMQAEASRARYINGAFQFEQRVVDPDTGGEKGTKPSQLGWIDPLALIELGNVAGYGAEKYAKWNYLKGYDWSLSYNAMMRHLNAFWSGEDIDPESGSSHLAHAAWHCLALLAFSIRDKGTDDRFK